MKAKKLATSTKSNLTKKKVAAVKAKVDVAMSESKPVKRRGVASIYRHYVPYILRACLNPFVFVQMTKSYFASLFDINYLKEVSFFCDLRFV